jgi:hypothetical protein
MPVGPLASGPLRACWLKAVLAKRGEVDHEVDTVDNSLAKVVAPVEHGGNLRSHSDGTYVLQGILQGAPKGT